MNQTENLSLPQWEADDRIMRTDFNAAMAGIDAALKAANDAVTTEAAARIAADTELANKSRFTKLKEINLSTNSNNVEINLQDVNWSAWNYVHLDCITTNGSQMSMYANESSPSSNYLFAMSPSLRSTDTYNPRITFQPAFQSKRFVSAVRGSTGAQLSITYAALTKLVITGDYMIAGAKFVLWGEK